jgi:hypothetical protein
MHTFNNHENFKTNCMHNIFLRHVYKRMELLCNKFRKLSIIFFMILAKKRKFNMKYFIKTLQNFKKGT